ncbi:hypothetical protein [Flavobacterium sp. KACC 22761]|uniref:hypothetical protein n=1 Tax=Flavobacterium sp. KACC 22761 TaxID=3092665 RepID=UPI002A74F0BD|nr:hypothetical protein [Flavobacterium sp. KACC 22761]WPO80785.1 hypothetical protein SCB73_10410 [Flavobacterium sp. KACC 22761]
MITEVLKNLAYLYYPKNICPWTQKEEYFETVEYKRLKTLIEHFDSDTSHEIRKNIRAEFDSDPVLKDFEDFSRLDWQDRCYTFFLNVVEGGELCSITLYLSILVPYYVIDIIIHKNQMIIPKSRIEELEKENVDPRRIKDLVLEIEHIVEKKFLYSKFPKEILNNKFEDISFQDSYLGEFKMFNAFFNNQIVHREGHGN